MIKTIKYFERSITYRDTGKGKTVVLLHGLAEDSEIWIRQEVFLQESFRLIIPDLPGSGKSQLQEDVSMEGLADSVKAILDEEGIDETIMIGHSMGGYVTLAFAEKFPEVLTAIGLFHSTAYADSEEKKLTRVKNMAFIESQGTFEYLKQSTPLLFSDGFSKANSETVFELIEKYQSFDPLALVAYLEAMKQRPDRTVLLKEFIKPILFIIGQQDNVIPFADSMEICHMPSLSYIHILENAGHMGMIEDVQQSNSILQNFLQTAGK